MPKTRKRRPSRDQQLPQELSARRARAQFEAQMYRLAAKQAKAQLATYASAGRGRRQRDWKAPVGSADLAILPDQSTLNARARQLVRDSWIARAAVRARSRNIVGRGIIPVPAAMDETGAELEWFNRPADELFWQWASDPRQCDVEGRRTFWQFQTIAAEEKFTVGETFIVWSIDPSDVGPGLKLQIFEPEQLDDQMQSHESHEVRNGIELDRMGRAVAYHFYERTPNDFLGRSRPESIRVPAEQVIHYHRPDRPGQTHGVSELAPVMQKIRDFQGFDDAMLFRARMEACIGFIVTKAMPTFGTAVPGIGPLASGDSATTTSGMRAFDMVPGMTPELMPGETIEPFIPSSPGTMFGPYTEASLRGIGAGIGLSYGALYRKSDGNYSSARQDMLEDERELGPEQDWFVDCVVKPIYELFIRAAIATGLLPVPVSVFAFEPRRYLDAEYVLPHRPWIDPEREANAAEKLLNLKLTTRSEIRASMGGRLSRTFQRLADESRMAAKYGITLADAATATAPVTPAATPAPDPTADPRYSDSTRILPTPTPAPPGRRLIQPPGVQEGDTPFDQQSSRDDRPSD